MRIGKENKTNRSILLVVINMIFCLCFFCWNILKVNILENVHELLFPWVCLLIIVQILSFKIKKISLYDFGFWFLILSYLFMFGLLIKDNLKLETTLLWTPISYYSNKELLQGYIFVIAALEAFSFAYSLCYCPQNAISRGDMSKIAPDKRMYTIGVVLLIVGGISKLINDLHIISVTQSANTYAAYTGAVRSGVWDDLACLVLPGLFFLFFCGCIDKRTKRLLFYVALLYFVLMMLLTGSRKIQIFSILSLLLGYDFSIEKRKMPLWKICVYSILVLFLINVVITIRSYRFNLTEVLPILIENIKELNLFDNILGETLAETGITFLSVASIIKVVPSVFPFEYGLTFLRTLPSFLPIGWLIGDYFQKASSTYVINTYTKIPVGSSFVGDLYWNWGYIGGIIAAFLFGVIVSRLLKVSHKRNVRYNYAMYFALFSQLIILARAELFDIFRPIIIMLFFIVLVKQFSSKKDRR